MDIWNWLALFCLVTWNQVCKALLTPPRDSAHRGERKPKEK